MSVRTSTSRSRPGVWVWLPGVIASLLIAVSCAAIVALAGGPTWAWLATGLITYFSTTPETE